MGLGNSIVGVVLLTDVAIVETLVGRSKLVAIIQEALSTDRTTCGLNSTRVVERWNQTYAVPSADAVVALSEVVGITIPHTYHGANVRDSVGCTLSVFGCKCKDDLRALHVVHRVKVAIVIVNGVVAIGSIDNLL